MEGSLNIIACWTGLCLLALLLPSTSSSQELTFTVETGLERLWDVSQLPKLRPEKLRMASSGAVYPEAKDGAEFLYRESNGEYVLLDATGPGCVVRYWSALIVPGTRIRFYFDGHSSPDVDMELIEMFTGKRFPWVHPVVGNDALSSGGFYSYLPMPYEKGCKVTLDRLPSFYHLETLNLSGYDRVQTFDLANIERYRPAVEDAVERLTSVGYPEVAARSRTTLACGETAAIASLKGPGVIEALTLRVEPGDSDTLREVLVRAFWDGEPSPSVWSPVGDFFVSGHRKTQFRALPLGSTEEGFYCRFPMPFAKSAEIELVNESTQDVTVEYGVAHRHMNEFPDDWGTFHARWSRVETRMGEYVTLLNARGRGKYVGVSFNPQSISPWMLEGDEVVWVDGELTPSIHGTGTEDYFSGAWYFSKGPFNLPTHGAPLLELDRKGLTSRVSLYRFHTLDPVSFSERVRFCIEHGQERSMQGSDYCYTTFWYQTEPHVPHFPVPSASQRLGNAATVVAYLERFAKWQKALNEQLDEKVAELGTELLQSFPNQANLNLVRYRTGRALERLGRMPDAIEVWRSAQDYWGIDYRETRLCATEAWVASGCKGEPPSALLEVKRLDNPQQPGEFDMAVWHALPTASDFHTHFPDPYLDTPADVQTEVRMAYDDTYLYLWARCWEPHPDKLTMSQAESDKLDLKRDAFIFCIDAERTYEAYPFIAVDAQGEMRAATTADGIDVWFGQKSMQRVEDGSAATRIGNDSWIVELRVPRESVGLTADVSGTISGLEFIRVRNAGLERPEVTMWGSGIIPILASEFSLARFE